MSYELFKKCKYTSNNSLKDYVKNTGLTINFFSENIMIRIFNMIQYTVFIILYDYIMSAIKEKYLNIDFMY